MFPNVAIVSFYLLSFLQIMKKRQSENCDVIVSSAWKRTMNPNRFSCLHAHCYLVSQTTLFAKFVAGEGWTLVWNTEIYAVNSHEAVSLSIPELESLPNELH